MDYIYKLTRKSKAVADDRFSFAQTTVRIFEAEYVFKPWGEGRRGSNENDRVISRRIGPTERAWDRSGETAHGQLFMYGKPEEGEAVYEYRCPRGIMFRDESGEGRSYKWVGKIIRTARGLTFAPTKVMQFVSSF